MSAAPFSRQRIERVIDQAMELAEAFRADFRSQYEGTAYGTTEVPDDVFLAAFEQQVAESPPVPITLPDGQQVVASPFVLALAFADGGDEIVRRFTRLRGGS